MNAIFRNIKVGRKIGLGYTLALLIACGGTIGGIFIGYTLRSRANQDADYAARKIHTLTQFQSALISLRLAEDRFAAAEDAQVKQQTLEEIASLSAETLLHWQTIETMVEEIEDYPKLHIHRKLPQFYRTHERSISASLLGIQYKTFDSALAPQTASSFAASADLSANAQALLLMIQADDFELLIEDLRLLLFAANKIYKDAQSSAVSAIFLGNIVELASLVFSGLASIMLGFVISRSITSPLKSVATTAQHIVETERFDSCIVVDSSDEIGALARTINQLIQWVRQYIQKLEEAQSQLIHTEKMSSLGQMVAGIAHEVNNPINFIHGNVAPLREYFQDMHDLLSLYKAEYPQPTPVIVEKQEEIELDFLLKDVDKLLGSVTMGTQRVRDIVVSLRNYSRLDEAIIKQVDIHDGIDSTLLILNHRIKLGVEIIKDYSELPLVHCSPAQLNQVFTNVITNSLDAMFEANSDLKQITITTRTLDSQQVQISLKDSGPGMPQEVQDRIFDPFFTTKDVGKGTGIGMGICLKIIQQHKGTIEFSSVVGKGTECVVTLPVVCLSCQEHMMSAAA